MSVINATIAAATRRMLQDNLAWNAARGQDFQRVAAMGAAGMIPRDASGNLKLPDDLLNALWRPFPGSSTVVNYSGGMSDGAPSAPQGTQSAPTPTPVAPAQASSPSASPVSAALSWGKIAAIAAALLGSGGLGGGIISYFSKPPAPASASAPNYPATSAIQGLKIGKRTPGN